MTISPQYLVLPSQASGFMPTLPGDIGLNSINLSLETSASDKEEAIVTGASTQSASWPAVRYGHPPLPASLLRRQEEAIHFAREYRRHHGDPVDNLMGILNQIADDAELWQSIVDEPYG